MDGDGSANSARGNTGLALLPGAIMTLYGWIAPFVRDGDGSVHDISILIVNTTLRFGGLALLAAAGLCMLGRREGVWADLIGSAVAGWLLLLVGIYWIVVDRDLNDFLITIFGIVLLSGVRHTWRMLSGVRPAPVATVANRVAVESPVVERDLPTVPEGPPPEDGYLAALGRSAKERREAREGRKGGDGGS